MLSKGTHNAGRRRFQLCAAARQVACHGADSDSIAGPCILAEPGGSIRVWLTLFTRLHVLTTNSLKM